MPAGRVPLLREALSRRIRALPRVSLQHEAPKRMSLAGAQAKLAINVDGTNWFEPLGSAASTHIVKPDHPQVEQWTHTAFNEYLCMQLAAAVGLAVPATSFQRIPESVYLVERFDRKTDRDGEVVRLPVIDACQLLGIDRTYKYRLNTAAQMIELAARCQTPAATRLALFRWSLYNLLVGNGDEHLKNLSIHLRANGIRLAPFYDLLSTAVYRSHPTLDRPDWSRAEVSLSVPGLACFGDFNRATLTELTRAIGVSASAALREATQMAMRLVQGLTGIEQRLESASADQAPSAGEWRMFRLIGHGLIGEQLRRLDLQRVSPTR